MELKRYEDGLDRDVPRMTSGAAKSFHEVSELIC
jgi:hypothetical protein